jgi:hypothetical protein
MSRAAGEKFTDDLDARGMDADENDAASRLWL